MKSKILIVLSLITFNLAGCGESPNANKATENINIESPKTQQQKIVRLGEALKTEYFDISVKKVGLQDGVDTGNELTDVNPEEGAKFLIIDVTFKNIDTESRMISEGDLLIKYNGKDYTFDKTEPILVKGYGSMLEQLNPLLTIKTKIVYKIPAEIKGKAYWNPGRSDKNQVVYLGEI